MKMNINMKKIVFFLLVQFVTLGAFAQEATIKEAEVAYTKEDYGKAIELYEGLLKTHGESAEIYYNLGNAYYKENKIAAAIARKTIQAVDEPIFVSSLRYEP